MARQKKPVHRVQMTEGKSADFTEPLVADRPQIKFEYGIVRIHRSW